MYRGNMQVPYRGRKTSTEMAHMWGRIDMYSLFRRDNLYITE